MSLNFLPGQPNNTLKAVCQSTWQDHTILTYCSGNNLIVLTNHFTRLQTIYHPSDCVAVDINPANGHIAVAFSNTVCIYKPLHQVMKNPKWVFCAKIFHDDSKVNTLSWGSNNELAIGSDYLSFWKVKDEFGEFEPHLLWTKKQSKAVYLCVLSEDSQIIASVGKYDTNVKIWKRISISGDQDIFDLTLISHPQPVTMLRWKRTGIICEKERSSHILYSLCSDSKLRVWTYYESDSKTTVQQWGVVNLNRERGQRFCSILDSWLVQRTLGQSHSEYLEYLSKKSPDLVIIADEKGDLDFVSLENLSHDPPRLMSQRKLFSSTMDSSSFVYNPKFLYFPELQLYDDKSGRISVVVHDVQGVLRHSLIDLSTLVDVKNRKLGLLEHKFTGHTKSIQKLFRSSDGEAILTTSRFSENCIWVPQHLSKGISLRKKNVICSESPIKDAVVLEKGGLVIVLLDNFKIQVWECPTVNSTKGSNLKGEYLLNPSKGYPLLMLNTPEKKHRHDRHFIGLIFASGETLGFEISFSEGISPVTCNSIDMGNEKAIYLISSIDPVNYGFNPDRSLISIMTREGIITTYKAAVNEKDDVITWIRTFKVDTGLENSSLISGSSIDKICIVDGSNKRMTLWDLKKAFLEHEENFEENIEDIDWTSTEFGQSIFSVGFEYNVLLFTQLRYDYTSKNPSYLPIENIDVSQHTTHSIGDSIWLKDGTFVVAAGNQLFIKDKSLDLKDKFTNQSIGSRKILSNDILHLSSVLNGPLPVYHPQLMIQALYAQKFQLVREILLRLFLKMRDFEFRSLPIAELGSTLDLDFSKFISSDENYQMDDYAEPYNSFNSAVAVALREKLTRTALPYLTRHQQVTLITVIEAIEELDKNQKVVDANGIMFILGTKLLGPHRTTQRTVTMRDVLWALYSNNRKLLYSMLTTKIDSWDRAQEYKIAYWARQDDLLTAFENIAKFEFTKNDKRDPGNCSIFYLALRKKQILIGLWRISIGHKEQQKMLKFLNNDFSEPRWRTAALKNAFVLLSKHRFMDAAGFFLLAGSLKDSVNVILKQINDLDLAIGVCRVYEGDSGPVLDSILTTYVLPNAVLSNDRWSTSFVYYKLKKPDLSIKALMKAPIDLEKNIDMIDSEKRINKSFLVEDPVLLMLYMRIRKSDLGYLKASLEIEPQLEYNTVSRVSGIYRRMGCDYLALSLVTNWEFMDRKMISDIQKTDSLAGVLADSKQALAVEPTTTSRVRESLFDKFDKDSKNADDKSPLNPPAKGNGVAFRPKNLLDQFGLCDSNTVGANSPVVQNENQDLAHSNGRPKSVEERNTGKENDHASKESHSKKSLNLLDQFSGTPTNGEIKTSKKSNKPRNLLDDFL